MSQLLTSSRILLVIFILGTKSAVGNETDEPLQPRYELDSSSIVSGFIESALSSGEGMVDLKDEEEGMLNQIMDSKFAIEFEPTGVYVATINMLGEEATIHGTFERSGEYLVLTPEASEKDLGTMNLTLRYGMLISESRVNRMAFLPPGHIDFELNRELLEACRGDKEFIEKVLNNGRDYEHLTLYRVILHSVCLSDRMDLIDLVAGSTYPLDFKIGERRLTPFMLAARNGKKAAYHRLLQFDIDPKNLDSSGRSILHYAALNADLELAVLALAKGLDPNLEDESGYYPFYLGAENASSELLWMLYDAGARLSPDREYKMTPSYEKAIKANDLEKVRVLLAFGADPLAVDKIRSKSAIDHALESKNDAILEILKAYLSNEGKAQTSSIQLAGDTAFWNAVRTGNLISLKALLDRGMNPNATDRFDNTPILVAAREGRLEAVQLLLENGADPNLPDDLKKSPLYTAILFDHYEVASVLLDAGANPNTKNSLGWSIPKVAANDGSKVLMDAAVRARCPIEIGDDENLSPMAVAVLNGRVDFVQSLIELGADLNGRGYAGEPLLHIAVRKNDEKMVAALLLAGADTQLIDQSGDTALHLAARESSLSVVQALLEAGLDANKPNKHGQIALAGMTSRLRDIKNGDYSEFADIIRELLGRGSNINTIDRWGKSLLQVSIELGNRQLIDLLLELGADIEAKNASGKSATMIAIENGQPDLFEYLFQKSPKISSADDTGNTLLHLSAKKGEQTSLAILIDAGSEINALNNYGNTPLHEAAISGQDTSVLVLLNAGADLTARNKNGMTPLHLAVTRGTIEPAGPREMTIMHLISNGANLETGDEFGRTPLHHTSHEGDSLATKLLIESGADLHSIDTFGQTPLHRAVDPLFSPVLNEGIGMRQAGIISILLKNGASREMRDKQSRTPAELARANGWDFAADSIDSWTPSIAITFPNSATSQPSSHKTPHPGPEPQVAVVVRSNQGAVRNTNLVPPDSHSRDKEKGDSFSDAGNPSLKEKVVVSGLPGGFTTFLHEGSTLFLSGDTFYKQVRDGFEVVDAPIGAILRALPKGATIERSGEQTVYQIGNVRLLQFTQYGTVVYEVLGN